MSPVISHIFPTVQLESRDMQGSYLTNIVKFLNVSLRTRADAFCRCSQLGGNTPPEGLESFAKAPKRSDGTIRPFENI